MKTKQLSFEIVIFKHIFCNYYHYIDKKVSFIFQNQVQSPDEHLSNTYIYILMIFDK